jgi:hypothetical protein
MRKLALIVAAVLLLGCAFTQEYPTAWGEKRTGDLSGKYSSDGIVDQQDGQKGPDAPDLHHIFWEKPSFNADAIQLLHRQKMLEVVAFLNNQPVASKRISLSEENTFKQSTFEAGAFIVETYRFWKTKDGLVVERDLVGFAAFTFLVPLLASEKIWYLYPSLQEK